MLRSDVGEKGQEGRHAAGSAQRIAGATAGAADHVPPDASRAARFTDFSRDEKVWTQIEAQLGDVRDELARYYGRTN